MKVLLDMQLELWNNRFSITKSNEKPLIVILVALIIFAGCLSQDSLKSNRSDTRELTEVKVALLPTISFAPFFIGIEEGFFEEQGKEIELVKFSQSTLWVPALAQGDIDVGAGGITASLFNSISRGLNIKVVADKGNLQGDCDYSAILVRKDLFESGEIRNVSDLKGQKIGLSYVSTWGYPYSEILKEGNLSLGDIDLINLRDGERIEALQTKGIAAATLGEPSLTQVIDMGLAVKLISWKEVLPDFQLGYILYGPNLLEKDSELGKRFMVAYLKAVRQYNEGKTERNIEIIQKYTELDKGLIERTCWPPIFSDGHINSQSLLEVQEWGYNNGYVDSLMGEDQLIDTSFIEYANEVLG